MPGATPRSGHEARIRGTLQAVTEERMTSKSPQPAAPRPLRSFLWSLLGGSVIGGAAVLAGFALGGETVETVATRPRAWWVLPGVIAALVGVLAWHELGHVVGGAFVGFRFVLFVAGPLRVVRELSGRITWGLNRDLGLVGGVAASVPLDDRDLSRRLAVVYGAGPAASLLLGAFAGVWLAATPVASTGWILAPVALTSALIGVVTLIPMPVGVFKSDGYRLLMLLRDGPEASQVRDMILLTAASLQGTRPRDWDRALVARVLDPAAAQTGVASLAHQHAHDSGDRTEAARWLPRMLADVSQMPRSLRPAGYLAAAIHSARLDGDAAAARRWLEAARGPSLFDVSTHRAMAECEILLVEGQAAAAATLARQQLTHGTAHAADHRERLEEISRLG